MMMTMSVPIPMYTMHPLRSNVVTESTQEYFGANIGGSSAQEGDRTLNGNDLESFALPVELLGQSV